ncbi:PilW family protein [Bacillus taeanensis]|uniref:Prepilin-type cleavage/methylation domain-containing protein n=1 Tax=Bacillus taeanensis TaxID=273032 RepID=A0A366Y5D1_9BACI|nr:prepilin-type N-terminal cleavage/methylation domain-containing protein [Bacillus taeanensis]RBW71584.1 hypothetical protein DS031_02220 [Bacillus taeanensis]
MKKRIYENQAGLTLLEVLITVTILGIVFSMSCSILLNGLQSSKKGQTLNMIQQEANIVLNFIKEAHYSTADRYYISCTSNEIVIDEFQITSTTFSYECTFSQNDHSFTEGTINPLLPLKIKLTIVNNETGKPFIIETAVKKR